MVDSAKKPDTYNLTLKPTAEDFEKGAVEIPKENVALCPWNSMTQRGQDMVRAVRIISGLFAGLLGTQLCTASGQTSGALAAEDEPRRSISLDGTWAFALDPKNVGEKETWSGSEKTLPERIQVPGCWQAQGFGGPQGCLRHHYEGPAWYKRSVFIPADWTGKTLWLKIGGATRYTKAYVNGKPVGSHDGFLTPFKFDISDVATPGSDNVIAVRVDNSGGGPVGCFNYFGNWGGIYRPVDIEAANARWIEDVFVIPDVDRSQARLRITLGARGNAAASRAKLKVRIFPLGTETKEESLAEKDLVVTQPPQEVETEIAVGMSNVKPWFPEAPHLYAAEVTLLADGDILDSRRVRFGMRNIDWTSGGLKVNGRPYFLRGYGDDNVEVFTGLPPASKEFFLKRLALTKSFGFNAVRFHSFSPFEECFQAADETGMFIQAELPAVYAHYFLPNRELLRKELARVLKSYRNHPSFFSLAMGNEFTGSAQNAELRNTVREFYDLAKKLDPTRPVLSNDGAADLLPTDIYAAHAASGGRPFILHEYGGYRGSLPDITARDKLTGLFAPWQGVVAQAKWVEEHALLADYPTLLKNSQLLFEIGRKILVETARKNPRIDGYSYWLITDFAAGVEGDTWHYGVLDQFWQPKQGTPEGMRKINSPTVLLLDADMLGCIGADRGKVIKILVSHYGSSPVEDGTLSWRLMLGDKTLLQGSQTGITANVGEVKQIATANLGALSLAKGEVLEFATELKESHGTHANSWPVWAFPPAVHPRPKAKIACQRHLAGAMAPYDLIKPFEPADRPDVLIASQLDGQTQRHVADGGKLLLFPRKNSMAGQSDFPLFLTQWQALGGNGPGTIIQRGGVMDQFPHRGFCEEQFFNLMQSGTAINMDVLPKGLRPEVWAVKPARQGMAPVSLSREAMLFAACSGKGKLLVCTFDVLGNLGVAHPEADCLFDLLLEYVVSGQFEPKVEVDLEKLLPAAVAKP